MKLNFKIILGAPKRKWALPVDRGGKVHFVAN